MLSKKYGMHLTSHSKNTLKIFVTFMVGMNIPVLKPYGS